MNRKQIVIDYLSNELKMLKDYNEIYGVNTAVSRMKSDKIDGAFQMAYKLDFISYEEFHSLRKSILYPEEN